MHAVYTDKDSITRLLADYMDAVAGADIATLKTIFHEKASMNGFLAGELIIGTPEIFFADLASKPSMKASNIQCTYVITDLQVTGNIAQAVILVDNFYGAACVEDHFHLLKINDSWKILCKTFTSL